MASMPNTSLLAHGFRPRDPFEPGTPIRVRRALLIGTRTWQPGEWLSWSAEREFSERQLRQFHEQGAIDTPAAERAGLTPAAPRGAI